MRDTRYEWAYIFGAVCPERATGAALVLPYANTEAMNLHLAEIARTVAPGAHAVLVLDGAGWHGGKDLAVPDNITLLTLPPYAPELNPVENVWQYLRGNKLAIHRLRRLPRHRRHLLRRLELLHRRPRHRRIHHFPPLGKGQSLGPLVLVPCRTLPRSGAVWLLAEPPSAAAALRESASRTE